MWDGLVFFFLKWEELQSCDKYKNQSKRNERMDLSTLKKPRIWKKKLWLKIIFQLLITPWTCPLCMELTNLALASISFAVQMNNECENTAGDEITSADCVGKIGINSLELFCNINLKYSQVSGCFWASKKKTGVQYNSTFQTSYNESRVKQF